MTFDAASITLTINGVDIVGGSFDDGGLPLASRPIAPARAMWTAAPGSTLERLLAPLDPEPPRARNFDGRLAWDGSWQRGAPLPLP